MTKILHTGTLDTLAGGPAMSTYLTLKGLIRNGVDASLMMFEPTDRKRLIGTDIETHFSKRPLENKLCYSPSLKRDIKAIDGVDIYHAQGVWQYPTYALADVARGRKKPYLITPRGMLYPQDIAKSNESFKRLSLRLRLLKDLNRAAAIHVTCDQEMIYCRDLGVTSPIAVIPNPIEIRDKYDGENRDKFRVGYLGRLHFRKNVEGLIRSFAANRELLRDSELVIIGSGDEKYENFLRSEVERLSLDNVIFKGFLSGDQKVKEISSLSLLAMPSEFENFGNVILEGLMQQIPCLATKGAPWEDLEKYGCGWWIEYNQDSLDEAIADAFRKYPEQLAQMGIKGRELAISQYSTDSTALRLIDLYNWILNGGEKPDFVYL